MMVRETMVRMQEDLRRAALGEMRQAHELAALAGRGAKEMRYDLKQWRAEGRIFSVEQDGVEYFPIYALDTDAGYRPYPVMAEVIRILYQTEGWSGCWALAAWFIGSNSFLDDQRPADLLASDPEWVTEAAQDEVDAWRYPHG